MAGDPAGDRELERLYELHYSRLVRLGVLLLRDQGRAEDVVQDAFVALHRRLDRPGRVDDPGAYLRRSVVNGAHSAGRRLSVARRQPVEPPSQLPGADTGTMAAERRRAVLEALSSLPRRQREVLALRHYLELTEREIAEALGISQGAVKSHASRGAASLRVLLADDLQEIR